MFVIKKSFVLLLAFVHKTLSVVFFCKMIGTGWWCWTKLILLANRKILHNISQAKPSELSMIAYKWVLKIIENRNNDLLLDLILIRGKNTFLYNTHLHTYTHTSK